MSVNKLVALALGLLVVVGYYHFGGTSKIKDTSDEEFNETVLHSQVPVLVDFYATWCGPCRRLAPILEEIAGKTDQFKLVEVDVDQHPDLAMQFQVRAIPCLILFKNGRIQDRRVGFQGKENLESMLRL